MTFHENMKYWVWLQRAAGKGANLERLLSPFGGDVRALYEADPGERERLRKRVRPGRAVEFCATAGGRTARKCYPAGREKGESPAQERNDRSPKARCSG